MSNENSFETFLNQQNEEAWASALAATLRSIHEVDRNATQVWFAFYPLSLFSALSEALDREQLAQQLLLQGDYELKNQIYSSHRFLYGHRFWPQVKRSLEAHAVEWERLQSVSSDGSQPKAHPTSLADQIFAVARGAAQELKLDESLLVGITAVAFMTVQQAGLAAFKAAPGKTNIDKNHARTSPDQIVRQRAKDDSQGLFGFLKTVNKQFTVTHDENDDRAKYKLNEGQDLAWVAAVDRSCDWVAIDPSRMEGPIPVECRSASCGTCWIGVLGGADRLSDVGAREAKKIKEFGYLDTAEPKPLIRLACQAQAQGAISLVIPPWNGQFGKYLKSLKRDDAPSHAVADKNSENRPELVQ
ncbi:MAG: hypothetical protein ABR607_02925 [Pyrinomonadaceae bacterium]